VTIISLLGLSGLYVALSLVIYAFGTSCPHELGIVEIGVAMSLAMAVAITTFKQLLGGGNQAESKAGFTVSLALIILLVLPILTALGHTGSNVSLWGLARDVLPYMFFVIPVFFIGMGEKDAVLMVRVIPIFIIFVGLVYSIRFGVYIHNNFGSVISFLISQNEMFMTDAVGRSESLTDDVLCLPFDAAVFFSGLFLTLSAFDRIISANGRQKLQGMAILMIAMLPIAALVFISSRAAFGLLALSLIAYGAKKVSKKNLLSISTILSTALILAWPVMTLVYELLIAKQVAVGANNKWDEVEVIYSTLANAGVEYIIIGLGWGAEFYNPAVGRVSSFSHSLISYFFLKSGIIGICLLSIYMWWLIRMLLRIFAQKINSHQIAVYSISTVIIISVFFQPLYKTPTYGLLLLYVLSMYKVLNSVPSQQAIGCLSTRNIDNYA
jgi:hypothetical protein